jgi:TRAP-type C4-dicarboxylate transport system permease small subunit
MIGQEVVMRYFFGRPSSWTVDVSGYVMLTLTFVGAAWVLKKEGHVSVDIMVTRFGKRAREIIDGIMSIAGALVCLLFTYVSFMASVEAYSAATMLVGGILFPKYIPLAIMAFGMFLLSVQFLVRSWLCFSGQRTV